MSKEFRVPATQLYQDSLLIGEEAAEAIAFGSKDPQPVTITDIAGQQRLGELHKKFKVLSGVAAIFKASGASPDSTILIRVEKGKSNPPSVLIRVESTSSAPTGLYLGLYHKASGALRSAEGSPFYLDPKRLKTHAFVCGMTGSGKTVLTKAVIEEALTTVIDKGARRVRLRDKLATQLAEPENRWYIGDPLTADMLVQKRKGKTPLSVISVTHLNTFEERAFVVAQVSYTLTSWMRTLGETETPRVLFVVDLKTLLQSAS